MMPVTQRPRSAASEAGGVPMIIGCFRAVDFARLSGTIAASMFFGPESKCIRDVILSIWYQQR
jgi:hypothetical protein